MLQTVLCGAACAAAAYLLGSLSFSIIVTRLVYHKDIRTFGSGNAGMTNEMCIRDRNAADFLCGQFHQPRLSAERAGCLRRQGYFRERPFQIRHHARAGAGVPHL